MRLETKVPVGLTDLSEIMGVFKEELKEWKHWEEMRSVIEDYNFRPQSKVILIAKLRKISKDCQNEGDYLFLAGVEKVIQKVIAMY